MLKIRRVATATAAALITMGVIAPAASAGGNWDYGTSRTVLSNGYLYTSLNSGTVSGWNVDDWYQKTGGGTITARFGYTYRGSSKTGGWFSQGANSTKRATWSNQTINTCDSLVGWLQVDGQQTFNNAPVTAC